MVQTDEERKKYLKDYNSRPEVMERRKERDQTPEFKAKERIRGKIHRAKPETKLTAKNIRDNTRLKILQHYSISLSNSSIPCCRCCGLNSHVDFLDIDHINGRKQMDSESKLVNIGYSSKLHDASLHKWIIGNNFPDGFQILCKNCNISKGMTKNNNKCPHERK